MSVLRLCLPVLLAATALVSAARADAAADRAAIETVVRAVFAGQAPDGKPASTLFTADADSQLDRLMELDRRLVRRSNEPWSEVTAPQVVIQSIRFVTPDVVLVDATNAQYGSVALGRRIPVLLVMRKVGKNWKIASLRVLTDPIMLP